MHACIFIWSNYHRNPTLSHFPCIDIDRHYYFMRQPKPLRIDKEKISLCQFKTSLNLNTVNETNINIKEISYCKVMLRECSETRYTYFNLCIVKTNSVIPIWVLWNCLFLNLNLLIIIIKNFLFIFIRILESFII